MVLVTGATGILGRVIVLELLKRGRSVLAAKRASSNIEEVKHSYRFYTEDANEYFNRIKWIDIDFEDIFSLQQALQGVEEVYHCAGYVSFDPGERRALYQTNIEGTRQLLFAVQESSVKKFCFVSSIAVLDGLDENGEMSENSNYNPKVEHSPYARSKHFAEMEVWRASAEGLNTVIINPGVIVGSGNWNASSGEMFSAFTKYPFAMSGSTPYVDVRDVAETAIQLMEKNCFGERYIIVSESKKILETANFIRKKMGLSPARMVPEIFLKIGYVLSVLLGWLIPKFRMMSKANIDAVTSDYRISNRKIVDELDYHFIPVTESIGFHLQNYISDAKSL